MTDSGQPDTGKEIFEIWERNVANYFDELFRNPTFLKNMGAALEQSLAWRQQVEAMGAQLTGPFATRADQVRILKELEALRTEVAALAHQVEKLSQAVAEMSCRSTSTGRRPPATEPEASKKRSPRRARPVADSGEN